MLVAYFVFVTCSLSDLFVCVLDVGLFTLCFDCTTVITCVVFVIVVDFVCWWLGFVGCCLIVFSLLIAAVCC